MFNTATTVHTCLGVRLALPAMHNVKDVMMANTPLLSPQYLMCTPYPLWEKMHRTHQRHHYDVFFYGIVDPAPTEKSPYSRSMIPEHTLRPCMRLRLRKKNSITPTDAS